MNNRERAAYGRQGAWAGNPDSVKNAPDFDTILADTLANLRHWANQNGIDYKRADARGASHFVYELIEEDR
jgi:hypothetical protein